jgi:hypothetical protein
MSTSESASSGASAAPLEGVSLRDAGIAGWVLAALFTAVGTFTDLTGNDSGSAEGDELVTWVVLMAVLAVVTYAIYRFWYGPAAQAADASNTALIGGILAVLAFPAFWTGLPPVLAVGALLLGLRAPRMAGKVGAGLAALALVAAAVLAVTG